MKIKTDTAREMCSIVRKNYPYPSSWIQYHFDIPKMLKETPADLRQTKLIEMSRINNENISKIMRLRDECCKFLDKPFTYFKTLVERIHEIKTLNCGEMSRLFYMVSRINGVKDKDIGLSEVWYNDTCTSGLIDHQIAKIDCEEGFVGVDPLLDLTESFDSLSDVYKKNYSKEMGIPKSAKVVFREENSSGEADVMPRLGYDESKELKKLYPSFVIKR